MCHGELQNQQVKAEHGRSSAQLFYFNCSEFFCLKTEVTKHPSFPIPPYSYTRPSLQHDPHRYHLRLDVSAWRSNQCQIDLCEAMVAYYPWWSCGYCRYGHIYTLAKKVQEGASSVEGVTADLYKVCFICTA